MITRRDLIGGLLFAASTPFLARLSAPAPAVLGARSLWRARTLEGQQPRLREGLSLRSLEAEGELEVRSAEGAHLVLNETAGEILSLCDGETPVSRIVDHLHERYAVSRPRLFAQVADTLFTLRRAGILRG